MMQADPVAAGLRACRTFSFFESADHGWLPPREPGHVFFESLGLKSEASPEDNGVIRFLCS
jgi:hypothetical protein